MSCSSSVISNSSCASALPRESCTAVTGCCTLAKPSLARVASRSIGEPRGAVAGRRSQRVLVDAAQDRAEPLGVVADLGRETPRPQRHRARHGLLHVRVAGQRGARLAPGERLERLGGRKRPGAQLPDALAQVQPQGGEHLVVARAPEVNARAGRAEARGEAPLERAVAVLVAELDVPGAALRAPRRAP